MKEKIINWDEVPDILSKDDFYRFCHISKSTALHLLRSGKVPCRFTGKKTRCYQICKKDVKVYLEQRAVFPELYSAPHGWYGRHYPCSIPAEMSEEVSAEMHTYFTELLAEYKDVLNTTEIAKLTGYGRTSVNHWCSKGKVRSFKKGNDNMIPKVFLIDYFCSFAFRSITRKTPWHVRTLMDFRSKRERCRMAFVKASAQNGGGQK